MGWGWNCIFLELQYRHWDTLWTSRKIPPYPLPSPQVSDIWDKDAWSGIYWMGSFSISGGFEMVLYGSSSYRSRGAAVDAQSAVGGLDPTTLKIENQGTL